ncbi:methyltransferase domain-containing protein, partial [Candidatus Bathyarchaeota archaeon]|nr:methyltransferase domain-containing protein [Candidatus Bathyarchaeota archaeon]
MPTSKIKEGNYVLLYLGRRKTYLVKVEKGKSFHTHKGFIEFDDLIGKEYGCTVLSNLRAEFTVLRPLLRDYIMKSVRRTQITYPKDVALMVMFSGIGPGSRVVEAGTGTGALTTALAHYVKPDGRVYSYEIREEFLKNAEKNLKRV